MTIRSRYKIIKLQLKIKLKGKPHFFFLLFLLLLLLLLFLFRSLSILAKERARKCYTVLSQATFLTMQSASKMIS